jgi:hypothetical protein
LVQIFGARTQDKFIDAHLGLAFDRFLHRFSGRRQRKQTLRGEFRIVAVIVVYVLGGLILRIGPKGEITGADPARLAWRWLSFHDCKMSRHIFCIACGSPPPGAI